MRTTIIPAQITTVEDRIAGSLNVNQILILLVPVLFSAVLYIAGAPALKLTPYKIVLAFLCIIICITLAIRIKDKIVAKWLLALLAYISRPRFFVYNKNNLTSRTVNIPVIHMPNFAAKNNFEAQIKVKNDEIKLTDLIKLDHLVSTGKVELNFQLGKKHL